MCAGQGVHLVLAVGTPYYTNMPAPLGAGSLATCAGYGSTAALQAALIAQMAVQQRLAKVTETFARHTLAACWESGSSSLL